MIYFVLLLLTTVTLVTAGGCNILEVTWDDLDSYCLTHSGVKLGQGHGNHKVIPPRDCQDLKNSGQLFSGVYTVYRCVLKKAVAIPVYCDMDTEGGGWLVFQNRFDGSQDFLQDWQAYKQGFGNMLGEFWLGNDFLSLLTTDQPQQLRVELEDFNGDKRYAQYSIFRVLPEYALYKMTVSGYHGDAGDSLTYHSGSSFSTSDRDNDAYGQNCAVLYPGAWWYKSCMDVNLNGEYFPDGVPPSDYKGLCWRGWRGEKVSLKATRMMIRPASD